LLTPGQRFTPPEYKNPTGPIFIPIWIPYQHLYKPEKKLREKLEVEEGGAQDNVM
jgi:hypothetical protein